MALNFPALSDYCIHLTATGNLPQSPIQVDPSDAYNCGTIANLTGVRSNVCFQKWADDPFGTCLKYAGSGFDPSRSGSFTGTFCTCDRGYVTSGYQCTERCTKPEEIAKCTGKSQQCLINWNTNQTECMCAKGYKLEQSTCVRQNNYCDTCEFNCHMSQQCKETGDRQTGFGYECGACDESLGFKASGSGGDTSWCTDIDECAENKNNCDERATCENKDPSFHNGTKYVCQCKTGWEGIGTKCRPCTDVDECSIEGVCGQNSNCENTPGSYTCKCRQGYEPSGTTYSAQGHQDCVDINECEKLRDACKAFSTCKNTNGSYECPCNPGYIGEGKILGCTLDPAICATCDKKTTTCEVNSAQTAYECQCVANHTTIAGNTTHCKPITYCDKGDAYTRCAPTPKATCTDNPDGSGYTCKCNKGYVDEGTGDATGKGYVCHSENPCERDAPCALVANTFCNWTKIGKGYECQCKLGYVRQLEGQGNDSAPCYEINGPMVKNCTQCRPNSEICTSVKGDSSSELMQCSCASGYKRYKGPTGFGECTNVDECLDVTLHNCDPIRAECHDEIPTKANNMTKFTCKCLAGYEGDGTRESCKDIDECTRIPDICGPDQDCENLSPFYKCHCKPGYQKRKDDPTLCEDINECERGSASCNAYATCRNEIGNYSCFCDIERNFIKNGSNEKGDTCGVINVCKEGLQGKGVRACKDPYHICIPDGNTYSCKCPDGFRAEGDTCININECADEQKNDCDTMTTTCKDSTPGYECVCKKGYEPIKGDKKRCKDVNECETRPLDQNCNPYSNCTNIAASYRCSCMDGYEIESGYLGLPVCRPKNPCASSINPCYGGICDYDPTRPPFYKCRCGYGLMKHNETTCIDSKYCDQTNHYPCPLNSKCNLKVCECDPGYTWGSVQMPLTPETFAKRSCEPINWCRGIGAKECEHRKCNNTGPGEGKCYCDPGFRMGPEKCEDRNECIEAQSNGTVLCPKNSECFNTVGSFKCVCSDGYYAIPEKSNETHPYCVDTDECLYEQHNCSAYKNTECKNLDGGFECICKPGFGPEQKGGRDDGRQSNRNCEWLDPCKHNNPCEERARCEVINKCAVCICPPGYDGSGTKELPCVDKDECMTRRDNCSKITEICINTNGSFACECKPGFEKNSKGVCDDINECKKTPAICQEKKNTVCNNTFGGHLCTCKKGFIYDEKTKTCIDFKECSQPGICGPSPGNTCKEQEGTYECICDPGYSRPCSKGDVKCPCRNINECNNATACDKNAICKDLPGDYLCICKKNYNGTSEEARKPGGCKYIPICERYKCEIPNSHCEPSFNEKSFECVCDEGYVKHDGVCLPNPCKKINCTGGACVHREIRGQLIAECQCYNSSEIYNNKTDACIDSNVCRCPGGAVSCTNSTACPDPYVQTCTPVGTKPDCSCFSYLKYNEKKKKCENCDECLGKCPPDAIRRILKDSLGYNYRRECICNKPGYKWRRSRDPLAPGKCIIDKDCSLDSFCNNVPNMICDHDRGLCICDRDDRWAKADNGSCYQISSCDLYKQQHNTLPCEENNGTIFDGRGDFCECDCLPGYWKDCVDGKFICRDIDECKRRPCDKKPEAPFCINTPGSYRCTCNETIESQGYIVNENGECGPPDLCISRAPCPDQTTCIPATGTCECNEGYKPGPEPCYDVNECDENKYVCADFSWCNNTDGSYECVCNKGYDRVSVEAYWAEGAYGGRYLDFKCIDKNECDENPNVCPDGAECFNYEGDYNCTCPDGFIQVTPKTCEKEDPCLKCHGNATCKMGPDGEKHCECKEHFNGTGVGEDGCKVIEYCNPDIVCDKLAKCIDKNPGYDCECPVGYEGRGRKGSEGCTLINHCEEPKNPCPKEAKCVILSPPAWTPDNITAKAFVNCICPIGFDFHRDTFTCEDRNECEAGRMKRSVEAGPCPWNANCTNTQGSYYCTCPDGYTYNSQDNKCDDEDECKIALADSCKPATGDCRNTNGSWVCDCKPGFQHKDGDDKICEYVDKCKTPANPCNLTTSDCYDTYESGLICKCKTGYQEHPDEQYKCVDVNECTFPNNCSAVSQTCENYDGGYRCHCRAGHKEENGKCVSETPCNSTCKDYSICVLGRDNKPGCVCIDHYQWILENETCSVVGCKDSDCGEGGKCVIIQNRNDSLENAQLHYGCQCSEGYSLDPIRHICRRGDVDRCEKENLCGIGACKPSSNKDGYECSCPGGECFPSCNTTVCHPLAECRTAARDGKVVITYCKCKDGYRGFGTITTGCFPIQDCDERLCSKYAACKLVDGKSTCVCDSHYKGNGTYCVDRDECEEKIHNCDKFAHCNNTQGGFKCNCKPGYTGTGTKGNCKDVNECDPNLRLSKCNMSSTTCNNTDGSYECNCLKGYRNTTYPFYQCPDIDECVEDTHTCGNHTCLNLVPSFTCKCDTGYQLAANNTACEDINECTKRADDCDMYATCHNTIGSFNCTCNEGYTGDGRMCEIIDKCANPDDNKCNKTRTTCIMATGQPNYRCDCLPGYKPPAGQSVWFDCEDIDECLNETLYNRKTTKCKNTEGSYELECILGYTNVHPNPSAQNATCEPRDECAEDPAWLETKNLLEFGNVNPAEWRKWMVPPKNPNSGYAFCYNEAVKNNRFFGSNVYLPNCANLEPEASMYPIWTSPTPPFTAPRGFTCACPNGGTSVKPLSTVYVEPICSNEICNCIEGFKCIQAKCVCADPNAKLRTVNNVSVCVNVECDGEYQYPPHLIEKRNQLRCSNGTFNAIQGYRLVRDNITQEVIDVVDIDECTENGVDPCCIDRSLCNDDQCVECRNIPGDYICVYRNGKSSMYCEGDAVDSTQCKCHETTCGYTTSWYSSCGDDCNVTLDKRLDDAKFNRPLCSRVFDLKNQQQFVTFPSLKSLYQYICSLSNLNQNKLGCLFDKSGADLTTSPLFNYWGVCTSNVDAVSCEGGASAIKINAFGAIVSQCPSRFTPIPKNPAIGQPIGQGWPTIPQCMGDSLEYYQQGNFFVLEGENVPLLYRSYPV